MADRIQWRLIGALAEPVVAVNASGDDLQLDLARGFESWAEMGQDLPAGQEEEKQSADRPQWVSCRSPWAVKVTARKAKATTRLAGTHPPEMPGERRDEDAYLVAVDAGGNAALRRKFRAVGRECHFPMSSFQSSGCSRMNWDIMSMHS